ncbi:porin [Amphritea sp. HPY]|uniref:porin n=1 Tax=Amphritea sp. HPY TaxID=3421652 RepID=UPI003D7DA545
MKMQKKLLTVSIAASLACFSTTSVLAAGHTEVEALRAQIEAMTKRLDQLEKQSANAEKMAAAAEEKAQMASQSSAGKGIQSGNDKVRVTLSGHVNRGLLWADDGESSNVYHVDNDASSTRMRVIGEADVSDDMTVGAAMEVQLESNSSSSVTQDDEDGTTSDGFTKRRAEVYFASKQYGKLWVGQGWTASEGTSEMDLSGTALAGYSATTDMAGGIKFRDSSGSFVSTGPDSFLTAGNVFTNYDGQGRQDRIRYDTPAFGGFTFSVGAIENDVWDTALRYSANYDGTKVAGAVAYSEPDSSSVDSRVNGSVSVLLQGGLNLTLAAGEQDASSGSDPSFYYAKLGYQTRMNGAGMTAFSVDYHGADDVHTDGDEATSYGLQVVQKIDSWSTETYLGWRTYELDRSGINLQDIDALIAGARVKF